MSAAGSTSDVHSQDHITSDDSSCAETSPEEDSLVEEPEIFHNFNYRDGQKPRFMAIDSDSTSSTDIASGSDCDSTSDSGLAVDFRLSSLDKNNNGSKNIAGSMDDLHSNAVAILSDTPSSTPQVDLFEDVGRVVDLVKSKGHTAALDPNVVYEKLERVLHSSNRVMIVANEIVQAEQPDIIVLDYDGLEANNVTQPARALQETAALAGSTMPNVNLIRSVCPDASLAEVISLMDTYDGHPNQMDLVIDHFITKTATASNAVQAKDTAAGVLDSITVDNNMTSLPDNAAPDIVLSGAEETSDDSKTIAIDLTTGEDPQPSTSASNPLESEQQSQSPGNGDHWTLLREMLPDADPDYLLAIVDQCHGNVEELMKQVNTCMELRNYPKLTEAIQRQEQHAIKRKYLERDFTVDEFLQLYDDPVVYFYNAERPVTNNYKEHVMIQLSNDFGLVYKDDLVRIVQKHNYHLTPAYRELQEIYGGNNEPSGKRRKCVNQRCKKKATPHQPLPNAFDETFYKEVVFLELEEAIKERRKEMEIARNMKLESAKLNNEVCTCGCCYDDELLLEEMLTCSDGHVFCRECIRRSSEENIGQGKLKFPCLSSDCTADIPLQTLQEALKPTVFSSLVRRLQEEEIRLAAIDDLVSCPFCSFSAIMSNPEDKVFKCLNPECLKESCRLCREPSHIPLRCEEVEKSHEVKMRTYIEDKMTESLLRTCPRCKRRFIKLDGCNKMTCQCGQIMCYVCREPIRDYSHFGTGRCPQFSDDHQLHVLEVQRGAEKAKKELLQEHPELGHLQLKHDPTKDLATGTQHVPGARPAGGFVPVLENDQIVFHQNQQPGGFPVHVYAPQQWMPMPPLPFMQAHHHLLHQRFRARHPPPPLNLLPQYPAGQRPPINRYVVERNMPTIVNKVTANNPMLNRIIGGRVREPAVQAQPVPFKMCATTTGPVNIPLLNTFPTGNEHKIIGTVGSVKGPVIRKNGNPPRPIQSFPAANPRTGAKTSSVVTTKDTPPHHTGETVASSHATVVGTRHSTVGNPVPAVNCTSLKPKSAWILDSSAEHNNIPNQRICNQRNKHDTYRKKTAASNTSSVISSLPHATVVDELPVNNQVRIYSSAATGPTPKFETSADTTKGKIRNVPTNTNTSAVSLSSVTKLVLASTSKPVSNVVMPSKFSVPDNVAPCRSTSMSRNTIISNPAPGMKAVPGSETSSRDSTAANLTCGSSFKPSTSHAKSSTSQGAPGLAPVNSVKSLTVLASGSTVLRSNAPKPFTQSVRISTPAAVTSRVINAICTAKSILRPSVLRSTTVATSSRNAAVTTNNCVPVASSAVFLRPAAIGQFQLQQNNSVFIQPPRNIPTSIVGQPVSDVNPSVVYVSSVTPDKLVETLLTGHTNSSVNSPESEHASNRVTAQRTVNLQQHTVEQQNMPTDPSLLPPS